MFTLTKKASRPQRAFTLARQGSSPRHAVLRSPTQVFRTRLHNLANPKSHQTAQPNPRKMITLQLVANANPFLSQPSENIPMAEPNNTPNRYHLEHPVTPMESISFKISPSNPFRIYFFHKHTGGWRHHRTSPLPLFRRFMTAAISLLLLLAQVSAIVGHAGGMLKKCP